MKRLLKGVLFLAVPTLLVLAFSASAGNTPTRRVVYASGPITALAVDGPRVVYSTDGNGVYVWNVRSGATSRVRRPRNSDSEAPRVQEVAIAGTRVAWITRTVTGNSQETSERLYTASITGAGSRELGHAVRVHEYTVVPPGLTQLWHGNWITGLVGSNNVLAVSRWRETPLPDGSGTRITNSSLSVIDARTGLRPIVEGEQGIVSNSADAGRVAVLRADGSVGIYSSTGVPVREIKPSSAQEITLGGGRLVALTKAKTLEVYGSETGSLQQSWPISTRRSVGHLQAYGRIALFSVDPKYSRRDLRLIDLKTGKRLTLPSQERSAWNDAAVGPLGIVYSGRHPTGRLTYVSTARVLAGIARGQLK